MSNIEPEDIEERGESTVSFSPPLYLQRYSAVGDVITKYQKEYNLHTVLDVGCAECRFVQRLKYLDFITYAVGLDIDEELLIRTSKCLKPQIGDYSRDRDLQFKVYAGSIADFEPSLSFFDVITGIEVIEHLHQPILDSMVRTIFEGLKPNIVILTTPNSEFNVVFPHFQGFRHWDHKFEWTREEFQKWATNIGLKYSYTVEFTGIGEPPVEYGGVGHCSQMAVFVTTSPKLCKSQHEAGPLIHYKEVFSAKIPGRNYSEEEKLLHEVTYTLNECFVKAQRDLDYEDLVDDKYPIQIADIISFSAELSRQKVTIQQVTKVLRKMNHEISDDLQCVLLDLNCDTDSDFEEDENEGILSVDNNIVSVIEEECWD